MCLGIGATPRFKEIEDALDRLRIPVIMPVRRPPPPTDLAIRPGGTVEAIRHIANSRLSELTQLRWGWRGMNGKPVTTFRAEGLRFTHGRCLIPAAWADVAAPRSAAAQVRLRPKDAAWFCLAGFWRRTGSDAESFTLLTLAARGELAQVAPRQLIVVAPSQWAAWLDESRDPTEALNAPADYAIEGPSSPAPAAPAKPATGEEAAGPPLS